VVHRDSIEINDEVKNHENKSNNKNIREISAKNSNNAIKVSINNNLIKINTKYKIFNNKKFNNKKIIYKNSFNIGNNEKFNQSFFTSINKNNNFNKKLSNDINYKFDFTNRSNTINSETKLYNTSNNSLINNKKYKSFINSPKKSENKKRIINDFNSISLNEKYNNQTYRTIKERSIKEKDMIKLISQQSGNISNNISFKNHLLQMKKKNGVGLYKAYLNDKYIYNRNIINNEISLTNPNSEYISFKNNINNLLHSDMNTIYYSITNLGNNSDNITKNKKNYFN
jgi:3-methyladenine DNA glycosylase AlkC